MPLLPNFILVGETVQIVIEFVKFPLRAGNIKQFPSPSTPPAPKASILIHLLKFVILCETSTSLPTDIPPVYLIVFLYILEPSIQVKPVSTSVVE